MIDDDPALTGKTGKKCPMLLDRFANMRGGTCKGSDCMAWRPVDGDKGYCGMAGTPVAVAEAITRRSMALATLHFQGGEG